MNIADINALGTRIRAEMAKAIIGQDDTIDHMLIALFSSGHVLLEGPLAPPRPSWRNALPRAFRSIMGASSSPPI